ncbi:MAG TPA: hypothetical protein VFY29_00675 [Terriglobia bacterium]|nr:hypothetical protein [Terriglobia bacterium]
MNTGKRFIGAIVITAALMWMISAQQQAAQPAPQPATPAAGAQPASPAQETAQRGQQAAQRGQTATQAAAQAARIGGHPNFNGIWQALNTAYWNLEAHSAEPLPEFWKLGAIGSIPAGRSVIRGGGPIPYLPEALKKRNENRANWPASDPEAKCYMLGVPRVTYHNMPFQIFQGGADADLVMVYPFAATNRVIWMKDHRELPVDSWMGKSMGAWEGDVLVVTTKYQNGDTWLDRAGNHHSNQLKVTERFTLIDQSHIRYEATLEDPLTYSRPWTIEMPLYRVIEENAQLMEHKCQPFADNLLYQDLLNPKP